jgi:hypothetical protein
MKALAIFAFIFLSLLSSAVSDTIEKEWANFKIKFNKSYESSNVEAKSELKALRFHRRSIGDNKTQSMKSETNTKTEFADLAMPLELFPSSSHTFSSKPENCLNFLSRKCLIALTTLTDVLEETRKWFTTTSWKAT